MESGPIPEQDLSQSGDGWETVGEELEQCDPTRFRELLRIARRIVEVRRDPIRAVQERLGLAWREKNRPKS